MGKDGASQRWRDYATETAVKSNISSFLNTVRSTGGVISH